MEQALRMTMLTKFHENERVLTNLTAQLENLSLKMKQINALDKRVTFLEEGLDVRGRLKETVKELKETKVDNIDLERAMKDKIGREEFKKMQEHSEYFLNWINYLEDHILKLKEKIENSDIIHAEEHQRIRKEVGIKISYDDFLTLQQPVKNRLKSFAFAIRKLKYMIEERDNDEIYSGGTFTQPLGVFAAVPKCLCCGRTVMAKSKLLGLRKSVTVTPWKKIKQPSFCDVCTKEPFTPTPTSKILIPVEVTKSKILPRAGPDKIPSPTEVTPAAEISAAPKVESDQLAEPEKHTRVKSDLQTAEEVKIADDGERAAGTESEGFVPDVIPEQKRSTISVHIPDTEEKDLSSTTIETAKVAMTLEHTLQDDSESVAEPHMDSASVESSDNSEVRRRRKTEEILERIDTGLYEAEMEKKADGARELKRQFSFTDLGVTRARQYEKITGKKGYWIQKEPEKFSVKVEEKEVKAPPRRIRRTSSATARIPAFRPTGGYHTISDPKRRSITTSAHLPPPKQTHDVLLRGTDGGMYFGREEKRLPEREVIKLEFEMFTKPPDDVEFDEIDWDEVFDFSKLQDIVSPPKPRYCGGEYTKTKRGERGVNFSPFRLPKSHASKRFNLEGNDGSIFSGVEPEGLTRSKDVEEAYARFKNYHV